MFPCWCLPAVSCRRTRPQQVIRPDRLFAICLRAARIAPSEDRHRSLVKTPPSIQQATSRQPRPRDQPAKWARRSPKPRGRYWKTERVGGRESCPAVSFYSRKTNSTALAQTDACRHGYRGNNSPRANAGHGCRREFNRPRFNDCLSPTLNRKRTAAPLSPRSRFCYQGNQPALGARCSAPCPTEVASSRCLSFFI